MDPDAEQTFERTLLDRRPEVRDEVVKSEAFQNWKRQMRTVDIAGTRFYVRGGDMLQDENQVALDWAYQRGLLSEADVEAAAREHAATIAASEDIELTDLGPE